MIATEQGINLAPVNFDDALQRMLEREREYRARWAAWSASQPRTKTCDRHGVIRKLNVELSLAASTQAKEFRVKFDPCLRCLTDEKLRAASDALRRGGLTDENVMHAGFENFVCRSKDDEANLATARAFAEKRRGFLIMAGSVGTGKTHLAVAVARAMGIKTRFTTHGAMLEGLRRRYNDKRAEDVVEACKAAGLFVLDEVGVSSGGADELPMLHGVLADRHARRRPTIITTNLTVDEIKETLGERMADRLRQSSVSVLTFAGESLRTRFRAEYHEEKK